MEKMKEMKSVSKKVDLKAENEDLKKIISSLEAEIVKLEKELRTLKNSKKVWFNFPWKKVKN
jgi:hypothetical protein